MGEDVSHSDFYWLASASLAVGEQVVADVAGQRIALEFEALDDLTLWLSDTLLDLDQPVTVVFGGDEQSVELTRTISTLAESLERRGDPALAASAVLDLPL